MLGREAPCRADHDRIRTDGGLGAEKAYIFCHGLVLDSGALLLSPQLVCTRTGRHTQALVGSLNNILEISPSNDILPRKRKPTMKTSQLYSYLVAGVCASAVGADQVSVLGNGVEYIGVQNKTSG